MLVAAQDLCLLFLVYCKLLKSCREMFLKLLHKLKIRSPRDHCKQARREGGRRGHCPGARGFREARGSELSGLKCKIHQLKLRLADAMMFFF